LSTKNQSDLEYNGAGVYKGCEKRRGGALRGFRGGYYMFSAPLALFGSLRYMTQL
jgi:hypothetical protein